jgi:hypothetical protein
VRSKGHLHRPLDVGDTFGKVAKKLGGVTGKGFMLGRAANPGGRPRDINGFRERCHERTPEIIEVMERVFFAGTWPPKFPSTRRASVYT